MRAKGLVAGLVGAFVALTVVFTGQVALAGQVEAAVPTAAVATQAAPARVAPAPTVAPARTLKVYRIPKPVRGGQRVIDKGCATLYQGPMPGTRQRGTTWIAGHNWAGWGHWAKIRRGSKVVVTGAAGRRVAYRVVGRTYIPRQGGTARGLVHHDLMLQTCAGTGTMFVYANRIR